MINLALFLHIYQPPTQFPEITKKITEESYIKIVERLKRSPLAKITLNICGSLTEQLEKFKVQSSKFKVLLEDIKNLTREGRIEFTGSAKYHPLLPKIPDSEIIRQVKLNEETNKAVFGDVWKPHGFFPPEMAYERRVGEIVERLGYSWILLDESAFPRKYGFRYSDRLYRLKRGSLKVFFREREASLKIAFGEVTNLQQFLSLLPKTPDKARSYIILAMDGETFGHHTPGQLDFLEQFFNSSCYKLVTVSELLAKFERIEEIEPLASTWGVTVEGVEHGRIFPRWDNPENPIHKMQWELYNLAIKVCRDAPPGRLYDRALHSDQFFWAAHDPCWHPKMVKRGARMLKDVVLLAPASSEKERKKAEWLYSKIVETGRKLYGEKVIEV